MKILREIGRQQWGHNYLAPMSAALRADPYALRRWIKGGKTPAKLPDRVVRMLRALVLRHVGVALSAAELLLKVQLQSDIADIALADRLRDLRDELEPAKKVVYGRVIEEPIEEPIELTGPSGEEPEWRKQMWRELEERAD
jgi:hypothetical protein